MGPCPPREQPVNGAGGRGQEHVRDAGRRLDAERVAIAGRVLDRDPAFLAGDPDRHGPARRAKFREPRICDNLRTLDPGDDLVDPQIADPSQQVVDSVGRARAPVVVQPLQPQLELHERGRIEQLAQFLLAEQLAQQVAVERQRLRTTLRYRRVAVVHVCGHVVEQERRSERGGAHRLDCVDRDVPPRDAR